MGSEIECVSFLELLMAPDNNSSTIANPHDAAAADDDDQSTLHHHSFQPCFDLTACSHSHQTPFNPNHSLPDFFINNFSNNCYNDYMLPSLPEQFYGPADVTTVFPDLLCLETSIEPPPPPPPQLLKCAKLEHMTSPGVGVVIPQPQLDSYSLDSIMTKPPAPPQEVAPRRRKVAVTKRMRVRDKMYALSKLMPGDYGRKNTMAETLEDAYKYVKFLQAQVCALQCMPAVSSPQPPGEGGGKLVSLTRQQLLQVVVNTPEAQVMMADKGLCVVSDEQLQVINKLQFKKQILHQIMSQIPL